MNTFFIHFIIMVAGVGLSVPISARTYLSQIESALLTAGIIALLNLIFIYGIKINA